MKQNLDRGSCIRTGQIISFAMAMGVIAFAIVAQAVGGFGFEVPAFMPWVVVGGAVLLVPLHLIITGVMTGQLRNKMEQDPPTADPGDQIAQFLMTMVIVRGALHEGFGFFAVLMASASPLCLVGVAVAVAMLVVNAPTQGKVSDLVNDVTRGQWT
jgi:hypothetical protein